MREIAFTASAPEVLAMLAPKIDQKRPREIERLIKPQPEEFQPGYFAFNDEVFIGEDAMESHLFHDVYGSDDNFPYGAAYAGGRADTLWVRETWQIQICNPIMERQEAGPFWYHELPENYLWNVKRDSKLFFRASTKRNIPRWLSPVTMPRWASRITLKNDGVYPKRKEGGRWVWVVQFEVVKGSNQ